MYRVLHFLYPPRFRREFGPQMLQLHRDQLRERGGRARLTAARDLLVTLPIQYLEAFMNLNPQNKLLAAAVVTTTGIVAFSLVGGALIALALMLLLAWILMSLLKERGTAASSGLWWKLTASGAGLFAILFVAVAAPRPQSWRDAIPADIAWPVGFYGFVLAIVLMLTGILTGLVQHVGRRHATS